MLTGWYQVRQTQARQLQSGNTPPNAQMQAMTKIFPVFFAFICLGLNAGATIYFVVSNVWRIGQQHLVIGKMYDQAIAAGQTQAARPSEPDRRRDRARERQRRQPPGNGKAKPGAEEVRRPNRHEARRRGAKGERQRQRRRARA